MKESTTHEEQLQFLRKIEGQVAGIQRMIEQERYCVDILTQIRSVIGALQRVESEVFRRHLEGCVLRTLQGNSDAEKSKKIDEVVKLVETFKKK